MSAKRSGEPRTAGELDALVRLWLDSFGSVNTRAAYGGDLAGFRQWCAEGGRLPLTATTEDLAAYFSWCETAGATSATVARRMSALDSFFSFACGAASRVGGSLSSFSRHSHFSPWLTDA